MRGGEFKRGGQFLISLVLFSILSLLSFPVQAAPSITITYPNGGETWSLGTSHTIRWAYAGNPGSTVRVELLRGWGVNKLISGSAAIGGGGSGSISFTVPSWQTLATNYKIRVTSTSNGAYTDLSDNYFTIGPNNIPTMIKIASPNGGETWTAGSIQTIRWNYTGAPGSAVKIELLRGGAVTRLIAGSAPMGSEGSGSFPWTVPSSQTPAADYKIKITSISNGAYTDSSDNTFRITQAEAQPSIRVTSPNGGETWLVGSTQTVRWNYTGNPGSAVKIILIKGGAVVTTLASGISMGSQGMGSFPWTLPSSLAPGADYRIRIESTAGIYSDGSDREFKISSGALGQKVVFHFGDIGGADPRVFFNHLADRYFSHLARGHRPVIIGSGDYCVVCNHEALRYFRNAVEEFMRLTGCQEEEIFLALGNHDDPARLNTWIWNQVWSQRRPPEGVERMGDLIIAWMHSEHPNLAYLKEEIGRKRAGCPSCIGILVGHKPLIMETQFLAQYQKFLLLEGWRLPTLALMQDLDINLFLTGHFEMHSVLMHDGVLHNRVTPARRGFEEFFITYDPASGSIMNVDVSTH